MERTKRLRSLDALRGFDMFFIMGGAGLLVAINELLPCEFTQTIAQQMEHASWSGFRAYDMVFPLFLFIAEISFPFSHAKSIEKGVPTRSIYLQIVRRAVTLIALGVLYNGFLKFDFENMRLASVLGRIGLAWAAAAAIYINVSVRGRIVICGAILLGYWALLALCPAPDVAGAMLYKMEGNLVGYIDRLLIPGRLYYGMFDPEGLLSTVPAVATALMGMFAGEIVRGRGALCDSRKALLLALIGMALLIVGGLWGVVMPINKSLWTSSFTCYTAGWSYILFALFYYLIDVVGWQRWTGFFTVIGLNSITIYLAQKVLNLKFTADFCGSGIETLLPGAVASVFSAAIYIAVCWLLLKFLDHHKIYLKV